MRGTVAAIGLITLVILLLGSCDDPFDVKGGPGTMEFDRDTVGLEKGDTLRLQPVVRDWQEQLVPEPIITWHSTNIHVVTVDKEGLLTAVGAGSAQVWAQFDALTGSVEVEVIHTPAEILLYEEYEGLFAGVLYPNQHVPVAVRVIGLDGTGVEKIDVSFSVDPDNGEVAGTATTDSTGVARVEWRLQGRSGSQSLQAVLPGSGLDPVDLTLQADWPGRQVATGHAHTCAVDLEGQVNCWGSGEEGRLGTGSTADELFPTAVADGRVFRAVAAARRHSCAVSADQLFCWGLNTRGTVDGVAEGSYSQVPLEQFPELAFRSIVTGTEFNCGLTAEGHAYCWGDNEFAQLGQGTRGGYNETPQRVGGTMEFIALAAGPQHACGLVADGQAFCWGNTDHGRTGTTDDWQGEPWALAPTAVKHIGGIERRFRAISAGHLHTCGIELGGGAYCWGDNLGGQQGIGFPANIYQPVTPVAGGHLFIGITTGKEHTCGIRDDGQVLCWGRKEDVDVYGIGAGSMTLSSIEPHPITGGTMYRDLASDHLHTCGIARDGGVYCWGRGDAGQLGDGETSSRLSPVRSGMDAAPGN